MTTWQRYVTRNPMKAETRRAFRKFFALGKQGKASKIGFAVLLILYVCIFAAFEYFAHDVDPQIWIQCEVAILMLVACIGFYSSISGERERRSWDVLRALPVTKGQIIVGKYLGSAFVVSIVWLALLPFTLSGVFTTQGDFGWELLPLSTRIGTDLMGNLIAYFSALLVLAITLFFSARCRTSISALCTSLVAVFTWVGIWPILLALLVPSDQNDDWLLRMSPFEVVSMVFDQHPKIAGFFWLIFSTVAVLVTLIVWTEKTLSFVEEKMEFVPRKKHA